MGATNSVLIDEEKKKTALLSASSGNYSGGEAQLRKSTNKKDKKEDTTPRPTYEVSLIVWAHEHVPLPEKFLLKISYESLDFVNIGDGLPLVQFPFQNIICWGSTNCNFQFRIFDFENPAATDLLKNTGILISLRTTQGKVIEENTMANVKSLMLDINQRALSKQEFSVLQHSIFDDTTGELREDFLTIVDQFTASGRMFLAKQGIELLQKVAIHAPFEKFDLVMLIYDRMISKESIQLLINTFEDPQERDNLILRLKLDKRITGTSNHTVLS